MAHEMRKIRVGRVEEAEAGRAEEDELFGRRPKAARNKDRGKVITRHALP
jgi:hypothetical protein